MPELPEVETTRAGIAPFLCGQTFAQVLIRQPKLRWPVNPDLARLLVGQTVSTVARRGKYLLLHTSAGVLIMHLGMSGSLRVYTAGTDTPPQKHDHADFTMTNGTVLRFCDPRRFGAIVWFAGAPEHHPLLQHLGPEPLTSSFDAVYLQRALARQKRAIKVALMDHTLVVGVGNIYANEALFYAGINPKRMANSLQSHEYEALVDAIRAVLTQALAAGGSTLRDFVHSDGRSGYFQQQYRVYGRQGQPCFCCASPVQKITQAQRSSFYCPVCQP